MGRTNVVLLVAEADLERTRSLQLELDRAGFEARSSVEAGQLGETAQQAWRRALADAVCVLVVWSRSSLGDPSFVGRAEDARLLGVACPLLLDGVTRDELPVGHQSAVCGELTGWDGSRAARPFPEIVHRARVLERARTKRRIGRGVKWTVIVSAVLVLGGYVARERARTQGAPPASATPSSALAPSKVSPELAAPQQRTAEQPALDAGVPAGERAARTGAQSATPARAPEAPTARSAQPRAQDHETPFGPNWSVWAKEASTLCKAGQGSACDELGWLRELGQGVRQDFAAALDSYERGCTLGAGNACYNAARMYEHGLGTAVDAERARQRLRRACELSAPGACFAERSGRIERSPQPSARAARLR